ncbi:hypothetical protein GEMRC1_008027 [Eukaryota sp. GEM-RC1]
MTTPQLSTPYMNTTAMFTMNKTLEEVRQLNVKEALKTYRSLVIPIVAGIGFGKTRLMLQKLLHHDCSFYFSFGRINLVESFPTASTSWRSLFAHGCTFNQGVYRIAQLFSSLMLINRDKMNFVSQSKSHHDNIYHLWQQLSVPDQCTTAHIRDVISTNFSVVEKSPIFLLDEVDTLVATKIEYNISLWECLVICVRLIQQYFSNKNLTFMCIVALTPKTLQLTDPNQRTPSVTSIDEDSDIPKRWINPITHCWSDSNANVGEELNAHLVPMSVLVGCRPKWNQLYNRLDTFDSSEVSTQQLLTAVD